MADHPSKCRLPFPLAAAGWPADDAPGGGRRGADDPPTDVVLLRRAERGDERAFTDLLARHEARLREFVRHTLGPHTNLIEDVTQEVLLQLHLSSRTFANGSTFRTWLYGLAKNVCRHELRRRKRCIDTGWVGEEPLRQLRDERLDPLETLARGEREAAIRRAVDSLPDHYRTVLKLRDWDELSYAQIAQVLEVPIGTVRSRLHNARTLLAELLEQWNPEHDR